MIELTEEAMFNFRACVSMIIISAIFVIVRVGLRFTLRQGLLLSDYLCILSLFFFYAYCAMILNHIFNVSKMGAFEGAFTAHPKVSMEETKKFMKMGYLTEIFFTNSVTVVKLSILAFYWTIFSVDAFHKRLITGTSILCGAWYICFLFLIIFQCNPINGLWEQFGSTKVCISTPKILLAVEVTNLFIDVIILLIPTFVVGKLKLNTAKKWSVLGMFLLGAAVCVSSIVRLTYIWQPPDVVVNFDTARTILLSTIQTGMAIVCACLPTLGPLLSGNRRLRSQGRSWYGSYREGRNNSSGYKMSDNPPSNNGRPWVDIGNERYHSSTRSWAAGEHDTISAESDNVPLGPFAPKQIWVQRDVHVR